MGNWFSCFHSKKSKHLNNDADNFETGINRPTSAEHHNEQSLFTIQPISLDSFSNSTMSFYFVLSETEELLADSSIGGADVKSHDALLGNIGAFAASTMRKSTILSNGTSNAGHLVNSATGNNTI